MIDPELKDRVTRHQLIKLLDKVRDYQAAGRGIPLRIKLLVARVQAHVPEPVQDKRQQVDGRYVVKIRPGTGGGKRVRLASTPTMTHEDAADVKEFMAQVPTVGYLAGWNSPGKRPTKVKPLSDRELRRRRQRDWDVKERPATVGLDDWELLRLVEVEQMESPAIAARLGGKVKPTAVRKRLERTRKALRSASS